MIRRVACGISGGVDSAVAAALLKDKGFDVQGVFMKNWDEIDETGICSLEKDYEDAKRVCNKLKIPLIEVNFVKQYWNDVFTNFLKDKQSGITSNPDILCNRNIKFKAFYNYCLGELNVDAIATGHYANTSFGPFLEKYEAGKSVRLLRPVDKYKDQTFFLSQVEQEPLCRTMFPIATFEKKTVRQIARDRELFNVSNKRDSVGICFVGKRKFKHFIKEYMESKPGNFIDFETGKVVGIHNGVHNFTIGQKCRLSGKCRPYYVLKIETSSNDIYVVSEREHPSLFCDTFTTDEPHWVYEEPDSLKNNSVFECYFRYQHTKPLIPCQMMKTQTGLIVKLIERARALTLGQFGVFFDDVECFGSGRITHVGPSLYFTDKLCLK